MGSKPSASARKTLPGVLVAAKAAMGDTAKFQVTQADARVRVVMAGEQRSGKSATMARFCKGTFPEEYEVTFQLS
jgi:GTPase SAR1 family protein